MAKRVSIAGALSGAARLTPLGDAVRVYVALIPAIAVYCSFLIAGGGVNSVLSPLVGLDTFYILYLVSTWITMYRSSAEDARQWALAQEDD